MFGRDKDHWPHGHEQSGGTHQPVVGVDQDGSFIYLPGSDVVPNGAVIRRMITGEFRLKIYASDPNNPNVNLNVAVDGTPSLTLTDATGTVTLTVAKLLALLNPTPAPAPAPVTRPTIPS